MMRKINTKGKKYMISAAIIAVLFAALSLWYSSYTIDLLTAESRMHLSEVAIQGAASVKRQVARDFDILEVLADGTISRPEVPLEEKMQRIKQQADKFGLFRIAIVDLQGNAISSDGYKFSVADRTFFQKAITGERALSEPIIDKIDGVTPGIVYAVPVYHEGKLVSVLFSGYTLDTLVNRIDITFYHESGMAFITNSDGDVLLHPVTDRQGKNILEVAQISNAEKKVENFKIGLKSGANGVARLEMGGEERFFAYAPIEGANDWILVTSLPSKVVFERSQKVIFFTMLLMMTIAVVFTLTIIYIVVTKSKSDARIMKLAYYDALTGMANLEGFKINTQEILEKSSPQQYTLLNFDIKQFRYLNRALGHSAGDSFLLYISQCLKNIAQKGETYARVGADQFVLLFLNKKNEEETKYYVEQLRETISAWEKNSQLYYPAQIAFGIYYLGESDIDIMASIEKSNIARKSIKSSYESEIAIYDKEMQHRIDYEKELENSMGLALENGEFQLFIQPKYNILTEKIVGGEALARWFRSNGTVVMPGDFIPLLEKTGSIYNLDMYMLEHLCQFMHSRMNRGERIVPISINQSRNYMYGSTYVDTICQKLNDADVPTRLIELEITENIVYTDLDQLIKVLNILHQKGFCISLDDFGSGYSSLNVLKDLKVDVLKLDRFMLGETLDSERETTIVTNIIRMAKELNMLIVAEGVETREQVEFLRKAGCEMVQGFYYSKPVPVEEFERMLQEESLE
ncbi:MAG: EAL domain-containing protein [Clostridium sp.]